MLKGSCSIGGVMRRAVASGWNDGFAKWDLLTVVAVLGVLTALLLPALGKAKKPFRIPCVNNLREVGLALRIWSNESGGKFPWQVTANHGGSTEASVQTRGFGVFEFASNPTKTMRRFLGPPPGQPAARDAGICGVEVTWLHFQALTNERPARSGVSVRHPAEGR
jgi:hypothetical protein